VINRREDDMERIFAFALALAIFGLIGMVITAISGFYPSTIYFFFGVTMLIGFAIGILVVLCSLFYYVLTGKELF
jgi:hypothetical protein